MAQRALLDNLALVFVIEDDPDPEFTWIDEGDGILIRTSKTRLQLLA